MSVMEISETLAAGRAAQELRLRRGEFELATQLGHVRTVGGAVSGRRRVARGEVERLRRAAGFPEVLRERVRTVGTAEGAELMDISPGRFTRLARAGYLVPVRFYLNRYRAVVWLYLAEELRAFASGEPGLLTGRLPRTTTGTPDAGTEGDAAAGKAARAVEDCRPRNWRGRRIGLLLHESDDRWERAAIVGSVLDPIQLAELVPDPYERACLNRLRPDLAPGRPGTEAGRETVRRLLSADDPDEISWHRSSLTALLADARRDRHAPRPSGTTPVEAHVPEQVPAPESARTSEPASAPEPARTSLRVRTVEPVPHGGGRGRPLLTRLRIRRSREREAGPASVVVPAGGGADRP
ncbi:hypothetical protein GCM10011583_22020 [Streptomyces camponoticapitis]|uniref:Transcriptional regulator n=1 Tax=Streptomyces camponoticapitis TaxID=1616125 RepID=A0ABQ2E2I1_9ACTN|nr:DUF6397 family protein [Streptomyces camponoticapitis]GGJ90236.1 hypothetical protein GCM10011583_22020 [Streptomyces camponoticapitis]